MATRRTLSEEQIERIIALREKGRGYGAISKEIGCGVSTVHWHCLKNGVIPPHGTKIRRASHHQRTVMRSGRVVRMFTTEEDALIKALDIQGYKPGVIAKRLKRRRNSVIGRLMTLARHDAVAEMLEQERA